jgi:ribosome biogenesis GTPase
VFDCLCDRSRTSFCGYRRAFGGCKFRDCGHQGEPGCAIEPAVRHGKLSLERLQNYRKLLAELHFQERKMNPEVARRDKERWKKIHKAMRNRPDGF